MNKIFLMVIGILIITSIQAQNDSYRVVGIVLDEQTKTPVEYATVSLFSSADSSLITGVMTDAVGQLTIPELESGSYFVDINMLGYKELHLTSISLSRESTINDLGTLFLQPDLEMLDEVVVTGNRHEIDYQIDKKVVNVSEALTSASMSAVEVLESVPSIRVDIEGNVSLRGSTGFTVLIDGKPSVLDANDVLQQTPASTIQSIEIITNPSAKYAPDGTGGVLNIITKKNRLLGLQGLVNLNTGSYGRYGGDALFNYKLKNFNIYVGGKYGKNPYTGESYSERQTVVDDITTIVQAGGAIEFIRYENDWRAGFSWDISENDNLTVESSFGEFNMESGSKLDYITTIDANNYSLKEYSQNMTKRDMSYISINTTYSHNFSEENHKLMFIGSYSDRDGDESSTNYLRAEDQTVTEGSKTTEIGPYNQLDIKLDYTKPVGENSMLEAGFQYRNNQSADQIRTYEFDPVSGDFINQPQFNNDITYDDKIGSVYSLYRGSMEDLGYQLGLRGEYTFREIIPVSSADIFTIDRWDLFPTVHLSYKLDDSNQLMTSYSRRIERPRGWYLEPFVTWSDMFNVRQGNPELEPEYVDAFELGYVKQWDNIQLSVESYYRVKSNKIERIQSVYSDGVLLSTYNNVGKDYSLGVEAMLSATVAKWWEISLTGDLFNYRLESERSGEAYTNESFTWSSRVSNTLSLWESIKVQLDGNYNSPSISSQGRSEGYYSINSAIRANFMDNKLSAVLQVRDIFQTTKFVSTTEGDGFYNYSSRKPNAPFVSLALSYRINNFKPFKKTGSSATEDF